MHVLCCISMWTLSFARYALLTVHSFARLTHLTASCSQSTEATVQNALQVEQNMHPGLKGRAFAIQQHQDIIAVRYSTDTVTQTLSWQHSIDVMQGCR